MAFGSMTSANPYNLPLTYDPTQAPLRRPPQTDPTQAMPPLSGGASPFGPGTTPSQGAYANAYAQPGTMGSGRMTPAANQYAPMAPDAGTKKGAGYLGSDLPPGFGAPVSSAVAGQTPNVQQSLDAVPGQTPPGGSGIIQPPDWYSNAEASVLRALNQMGMPTGGFNPYVQAIQQRSKELVDSLLARTIGQGYGAGGVNNLMNNDYMMGQLQNLIREANTGGKVLGGYGRNVLTQAADMWREADATAQGGQPGAQWVAELVGTDPQRALDFASNILYGGLSPFARKAATQPLQTIYDTYRQLLESGGAANKSILDVLMENQPYGMNYYR